MIYCKFCKQVAPYTPLDEMEAYGVKVYFCVTCQAEYLFWSEADSCSVSLYTEINHKLYRFTTDKAGIIRLWYIKDPGLPGTRINRNLTLLKVFGTEKNEVSEITPQNINNKIRTWLLFL